MKLASPQAEAYGRDSMSAFQAQRFAQLIAWSPVVFQVTNVMVKWGIFDLLAENKCGLSIDEVAEQKGISHYAAQILLEGSLVIGTVYLKDGKFCVTKVARYFMRDGMALRDLNFIHDVNYLGLFSLEDALKNGKPEGLKVFGEWPTIYEGLSSLPKQVQRSWFGYDHYYSDNSFPEALELVFGKKKTRSLLDVGGNTGRWAVQCIDYDKDVKVTIMDLPQQLELMRQATNSHPASERIGGYPANLLDENQAFPTGFDAIWMSQFLDCFSEEQVVSILSRAAKSMGSGSRLYIMETLWDRQRFETASFSLAMASVYFTAMANGNSKMFYSEDLFRLVRQAGMEVEEVHDGLGLGHSILICKKA